MQAHHESFVERFNSAHGVEFLRRNVEEEIIIINNVTSEYEGAFYVLMDEWEGSGGDGEGGRYSNNRSGWVRKAEN